jgi:hypothetical protein
MRIVLVSVILGLTALSTSAFAVPAVSNIFAAGFGTTVGVGDGSGTLPRVLLSLPVAGL